jgi:stearoyl-CoA desaturase (Delta-9 desaturase)
LVQIHYDVRAMVQDMSRLERNINLVAVFGPFVVLAAVVPLAWRTDLLNWSDILVFAVLYVVTGLGITVGFHRLLTHRAFQTHKWLEYTFAIAGSLAVQGRVIDWVADHRKHHAHTDADGDPHSPHAGQGSGIRGALRGLYHAHIGWLFSEQGRARPDKYARDLFEDAGMRRIHRSFLWIVLATFALPFALGFALTQSLHGALTALLWGGLVRVTLLHHVTWSINSVCHFFGRRRFATDDHSTNVFWLAPLSFGESWHHNHHAFPRSAFHGLRPWELDIGALLVRALRRTGLIWNVVEITPERQTELQRAA